MRRLLNALSAYLEARAEQMKAPEHQPEGNNFTMAERAPDVRQHELNNDERPEAYGRAISLRWHPKV